MVVFSHYSLFKLLTVLFKQNQWIYKNANVCFTKSSIIAIINIFLNIQMCGDANVCVYMQNMSLLVVRNCWFVENLLLRYRDILDISKVLQMIKMAFITAREVGISSNTFVDYNYSFYGKDLYHNLCAILFTKLSLTDLKSNLIVSLRFMVSDLQQLFSDQSLLNLLFPRSCFQLKM